jgi:hypothetical protein
MHRKELERKKDSASFLYREQGIKMVTNSLENSISRLKTKIANFLWMRGENMNFVLYFLGKCTTQSQILLGDNDVGIYAVSHVSAK